jgi:hypothetical protein
MSGVEVDTTELLSRIAQLEREKADLVREVGDLFFECIQAQRERDQALNLLHGVQSYLSDAVEGFMTPTARQLAAHVLRMLAKV